MADWKVLGTHERARKNRAATVEVVLSLRCGSRLDLVVLGEAPMSEAEIDAATTEALAVRMGLVVVPARPTTAEAIDSLFAPVLAAKAAR